MQKINLKQILGGISISLFTLTALIIINKSPQIARVATKFADNLDTALAQPIGEIEQKDAPVPNNVIIGSFNPRTPGNIIYSAGDNAGIKFHYKAIRSEKLKNRDLSPTLKLEVKNGGTLSWKQTDWSWIDYNQGILYFHYKTEKNSVETNPENYTGKYQLILN